MPGAIYAVVPWSRDGSTYTLDQAIKTYKRESAADAFAKKVGGNMVVRSFNQLGEQTFGRRNPKGTIERLEIYDPMSAGLFKSGKREVRGYSKNREWFYEDGTPIEVGGVSVAMVKGYRDNPSSKGMPAGSKLAGRDQLSIWGDRMALVEAPYYDASDLPEFDPATQSLKYTVYLSDLPADEKLFGQDISFYYGHKTLYDQPFHYRPRGGMGSFKGQLSEPFKVWVHINLKDLTDRQDSTVQRYLDREGYVDIRRHPLTQAKWKKLLRVPTFAETQSMDSDFANAADEAVGGEYDDEKAERSWRALPGIYVTKKRGGIKFVVDRAKRNPHEIPLCPVCRKPAHATESDDMNRHPECQPPGERWQPTRTYRGVAYPPEGMTGNPGEDHLWKITFDNGSTRTVRAPTHGDAKRKILSGVGAARLPSIYSIVLQGKRNPGDTIEVRKTGPGRWTLYSGGRHHRGPFTIEADGPSRFAIWEHETHDIGGRKYEDGAKRYLTGGFDSRAQAEKIIKGWGGKAARRNPYDPESQHPRTHQEAHDTLVREGYMPVPGSSRYEDHYGDVARILPLPGPGDTFYIELEHEEPDDPGYYPNPGSDLDFEKTDMGWFVSTGRSGLRVVGLPSGPFASKKDAEIVGEARMSGVRGSVDSILSEASGDGAYSLHHRFTDVAHKAKPYGGHENPVGLTYGMLPTRSEFAQVVEPELPFYAELKGEDARVASDSGYYGDRIDDPDELYDLISSLINQWEDGDEAAGDLASGIMQVSGFEWI